MGRKTFLWVLCVLLALGTVCTAAHVGYAIHAYRHCSIIPFVAKELW